MYIKPVMTSYSTQDLKQIVARASTVCADVSFYCPSKSDSCSSWDNVNCPLFGGR